MDPSPELWDELTNEETAFALLAQDEGLTSFAEMEVWLESHPDYTPSELGPGTGELKRLQQRLRSLKLEQLDATLKRRDSRRAARQSEERKVMFDLTTAPDYEMQRCTVGGRYDKMIKESNLDVRSEYAAVMAADTDALYLHNELDGADPRRDFQSTEFRALPTAHMRALPNGHGLRIAKANGELYTDKELATATRVLREDEKSIRARLAERRYKFLVIPPSMFGTTDDENGLAATAPAVFNVLMHVVQRLASAASNRADKTVTHVNGAPYRRYRGKYFANATGGVASKTARFMDRLEKQSGADGTAPMAWDPNEKRASGDRCDLVSSELDFRRSPTLLVL